MRRRALVLAATGMGASASLLAGRARTLTLPAFTENLPPISYSEAGEVRGFATELLRMMAEQAGITLSIEVMPWQRALQSAQAQPGSILYAVTRTPERESQFLWIGPISARRIVIYKLASRKDLGTPDLRRLGSARIGVVRESAAARQLVSEGLRPGVELDLALDDENNLRKLLAGRMDYLVMLDWAAAWRLRKAELPYTTLQPVLDYDSSKSYWFGLHPDTDPELLRRLQAAFESVRRDGRYEELRRQYFR